MANQYSAVEAAGSGNSLFKRACDACRARKVKCDKESPCSACKASNLSCGTTEPQAGTKRKRIHLSDEYEKKIDLIEEKLASLDQVLQARPLPQHSPGVRRSSAQTSPATNSTDVTKHRTLFSDDDGQPGAEGDGFEGETSLNAQSIQARALVERVLGQGSFASTSSEVSSAISTLKDIVNATKETIPSPTTRNSNPRGGGFDLRKLPLPPTDAVLDVLRSSRDTQTVLLDLPLNVMTLSRLTDLCRSVFFSVDDYPTSTAILVFGNLFALFHEFSTQATNVTEKNELAQFSNLCRSNFETCISSLDILLPATPENIEALVMGAAHGVETSRLNVSWKLKTIALSLMQTLGWHRAKSIENDDQETKLLKQTIFWFAYVLDKGLSLRLGRVSCFRDDDIDLPYPYHGPSPLEKHCTEILIIQIEFCRIQGLVYEQLFAPGALQKNHTERTQRAHTLTAALEVLYERSAAVSNPTIEPSDPTKSYQYNVQGMLSLYALSDLITHYTTLAMIHRAIPATNSESGLSPECLDAARSALRHHQSAIHLKTADPERWSWYVAWTILYAPFIPFLVVFSHVLATADTMDLARLHDFVESISDCAAGEAARKMHHVCSMFYSIARLYVNVKQRQQPKFPGICPITPGVLPDSALFNGSCDLSALNPYLNAIGFAGDPMLDLDNGISTDAGDWFTGNQFVMGLMDDDVPSTNFA